MVVAIFRGPTPSIYVPRSDLGFGISITIRSTEASLAMPNAARNIFRRPGVCQGVAPDALPHSGPFDDEGRPITTQQTNLDNQIQAGDHCPAQVPVLGLDSLAV